MPSSLIIVALVGAWLLVLVPIVARRRQEVARTADSTLAARVVRSGGVRSTAEEESMMAKAGEVDTAQEDHFDEDGRVEAYEAHDEESYGAAETNSDDGGYAEYSQATRSGVRPYRPGRGGFDPEAAELTARARYAFRQRVVVLMLLSALITGLLAGLLSPMVWWLHVVVDIGLVGYLGYLRRQVRIEEEIRERRTARLGGPVRGVDDAVYRDEMVEATPMNEPRSAPPLRRPMARYRHPGAVVVDVDDEDPMFAELDEPGALPYRRAVGE